MFVDPFLHAGKVKFGNWTQAGGGGDVYTQLGMNYKDAGKKGDGKKRNLGQDPEFQGVSVNKKIAVKEMGLLGKLAKLRKAEIEKFLG